MSIKSTMLDGRVLRSRSIAGIDQEIWALLTVYQGLIRLAADAVATVPGLPMERISFAVLLEAAGNQVVTATGTLTAATNPLRGPIGDIILDDLLPEVKRQRVKARSRKNTTSKYAANAGTHPQQTQTYTFHTHVQVMENGLASRARK